MAGVFRKKSAGLSKCPPAIHYFTNKTNIKFWPVQHCISQELLLILVPLIISKEEVGLEGEVAGGGNTGYATDAAQDIIGWEIFICSTSFFYKTGLLRYN